MSTHNVCFYGEIGKIIPKLSSSTLLICSTEILQRDLKTFDEKSFTWNGFLKVVHCVPL